MVPGARLDFACREGRREGPDNPADSQNRSAGILAKHIVFRSDSDENSRKEPTSFHLPAAETEWPPVGVIAGLTQGLHHAIGGVGIEAVHDNLPDLWPVLQDPAHDPHACLWRIDVLTRYNWCRAAQVRRVTLAEKSWRQGQDLISQP